MGQKEFLLKIESCYDTIKQSIIVYKRRNLDKNGGVCRWQMKTE